MNAEIVLASGNRSFFVDEIHYPCAFRDEQFILIFAFAYARISLQAGLAGLWIPLMGTTSFSVNGSDALAKKGCIYGSDSKKHLVADVSAGSSCLAIIATQSLWSASLAPWHAQPPQACAIFPAFHTANVGLRRRLLRFARDYAKKRLERPNVSLLASSVIELQSKFDPLLARCPGSSARTKRSTFWRLQRSINHVMFSRGYSVRVSELALIAEYSLHAFIKVFYRVYGSTPYAYITWLRVERARQMLVNSDLAVEDVAMSVGIASRATFGRIVKRSLGQSATAVRNKARLE